MQSLVEKGGATFEGLKLLLCEKPLPPIDEAIAAAQAEAPRGNYYTEPYSAPLRRLIAEQLKVPERLIHVNAGSELILRQLFGRLGATTKRYTLGLRLWEMGARVAGRTGLVEAARPALKWLTSVTGQTSALVVLRDTDVLYVDIVEGLESLRFYADLGARAPAYATASGKAMLAHRADLVPGVVRKGLPRLAPGTITRPADLHRRLDEIRRTGLSINRGERRDDIAAVAAPIFDGRGECVASISISGPRTRFSDDTLEDFARHVRKASDEISLKLGYRERP